MIAGHVIDSDLAITDLSSAKEELGPLIPQVSLSWREVSGSVAEGSGNDLRTRCLTRCNFIVRVKSSYFYASGSTKFLTRQRMKII